MRTLYLGGPINGCTDTEASGWRDDFKAQLPGWTFRDPMDRDYRGREADCVDEIVELDKADIDASDIVLAYCWQPSWGTSMEILYAWEKGKFVLVVVPPQTRVSPWLAYHSQVVLPALGAAAAWLGEVGSLGSVR